MVPQWGHQWYPLETMESVGFSWFQLNTNRFQVDRDEADRNEPDRDASRCTAGATPRHKGCSASGGLQRALRSADHSHGSNPLNGTVGTRGKSLNHGWRLRWQMVVVHSCTY